ncbi:hypothetical protein D3C81_1557100 [compost metagenome]
MRLTEPNKGEILAKPAWVKYAPISNSGCTPPLTRRIIFSTRLPPTTTELFDCSADR